MRPLSHPIMFNERNMLLLIYDPQITGHHSEYIQHLAEYLANKELENSYYFIVSEEFLEKFPEIVNKTNGNKKIFWEYIPKAEVIKLQNISLVRRSFAEYNIVKKYVKKLSASHVIIMFFDIFQLSLIFKRPAFTVSGILFLQFYRIKSKNIKSKIKYLRKYWITKFYSRNKQIKRVFVLNDAKAEQYLNKEFETDVFRMLPDPVPKLMPLENFDVYKEYNIDKQKKIYLHIGVLSDKKGTLEILDAIPFFTNDEQKKICFIFAGTSKSNYKNKIKDKIEFYKKNSDVQIIWIDEFMSNNLMKSFLNSSYTVLIPYKKTESSSGVYGHATAAGKIVIGTSQGLPGELIKNYELGITCDTIDGKEIANAMRKAEKMDNNIKIERNTQNTPLEFSTILIDGD